MARIAVLGAGISGCCLALALTRRGFDVDLFDQRPAPMLGASIHGEGKLHLGFVYANDPSRATLELMVKGSLAFSGIITELTGVTPAAYGRSTPFYYAVADDSLLGVDRLEAHYAAVAQCIHAEQRRTPARYLGEDIDQVFRRCPPDEVARLFGSGVQAAFETAERAIPTAALAQQLRAAIAGDRQIRFLGSTEVVAALPDTEGVLVRSNAAGVEQRTRYEACANCLWDGRLVIDRTAGIVPKRSFLFRYKASVRARAPRLASSPMPSTTLVLGPYGDLVHFGNGDFYVSWYPSFKLGQSAELDGRPLHRKLDEVDRDALAREGIEAMAKYVPAMRELLADDVAVELGGGVIFAWGSTDIDDVDSQLHQRSAVGTAMHGRYLSLDTGKYCTGPMFAMQAATMLTELLA